MTNPIYDKVDDFYIKFVDSGLATTHSLFYQTIEYLLELVDDVTDKWVLDLCCGEGHVARALAAKGAFVTGIDLAAVNIAAAHERSNTLDNQTYHVDDAQTLATLDDDTFDMVICKMALMDIPDVTATFRSVARVLKPEGRFIAALLHPCFETPFTVPFERMEVDDEDNFVSLRVQRYFDEGHWNSGGTGVRGHVGAYHRTISTYVNELLKAGFQLARLEEPLLKAGLPESVEAQMSIQLPRMLFWEALI